MTIDAQKFCIWSGILGALLIFTGLWPLMQFVPAPRPSASAAEIAAMFQANGLGVIAGGTLMVAGFAMMIPFYAAISVCIERMTGDGSPLAKAQFGLGILAVCVPGVVGSTAWILAAYRAGRSDEVVQLLNDLGWVVIFMPVVAGLLQVFMLGIAVFNDRSAQPLFPRWFGFFNIWIGVAFLPGGLLAFFTTGPFAWNGLFCYWLGLAAFGLWFVVTARMLLKQAG